MPVQDGPSCPGCGLANYSGLCPHCQGSQDKYERELVPPFESSRHCENCGTLLDHGLCENCQELEIIKMRFAEEIAEMENEN